MNKLEICCDASIKKYPNGREFGCAGAVAIGYGEVFRILPDTTNNRSECIAVLLAIKLAKEIVDSSNEPFDEITIYSDSKFVIYGLKEWFSKWLSTRDNNGIMYNYSGEPVKNQELFLCIIHCLSQNNLKINFRHQKGHINYNNPNKLAIANKVFYESNGYTLSPEDIYRITYYNCKIDNETRAKLNTVNPDEFRQINHDKSHIIMANYVVPTNYTQYIL